MKKSIAIIRGASSSGKTSFANLITNAVVCSADDYFYDDHGNYNWEASKLSHAHAACMDKFDEALKDDTIDNIVVANVNSKPSDWSYYENQGKNAGIRVYFIVIERRHDNVNSHAVPQHTLERQSITIKQNLKLL